MKEPEDVRTAKSLYAEYQILQKYADRALVPLEQEYYQGMANRTRSRINFKLLGTQKKKRYEEEENYGG
jgi:hypothetical protein